MAKIFKSVLSREPMIKVLLSKEEYINFKMVHQIGTLNNKLILKVQKVDRNNKRMIFFPQRKIKLSDYIRNGVDRLSFFKFLSQTVEVVKKLELCELPLKNLRLNLENVFINPSTMEMSFLYLPIVTKEIIAVNIVEFIKSFIFNAVYSNNGNSDYVEKTIKFINEHKRFSVNEYEKFIIENSISNFSKNERLKTKRQEFKDHRDIYSDNAPNDQVPKVKDEYYIEKNDFSGETIVLNDTVVLDNHEMPKKEVTACLIRLSTNEKVVINKPFFTIGKNSDCSDYAVNNPAVSRTHAEITAQNGSFFITEKNSTNKTFINGKMIAPQTPVEIENEDNIKLANELFKFEIER